MNNQEIKQTIKDLKDGLNSKFTPSQFKPRMVAKIKELEGKLIPETKAEVREYLEVPKGKDPKVVKTYPSPERKNQTTKFKRNPFDKIVNDAQARSSAEFKAKREKEELAKGIASKLEAKKQTETSITEKLKKSVPVSKASTKYAEDEDGYCDKVIAQAKERRAKAKARSQEPQKTEGTKNKEKIEKVVENVKERAKADDISKSELWKLIQETEQLLNLLKKSYQDKITNGE
jgi:hypothetical protein